MASSTARSKIREKTLLGGIWGDMEMRSRAEAEMSATRDGRVGDAPPSRTDGWVGGVASGGKNATECSTPALTPRPSHGQSGSSRREIQVISSFSAVLSALLFMSAQRVSRARPRPGIRYGIGSGVRWRGRFRRGSDFHSETIPADDDELVGRVIVYKPAIFFGRGSRQPSSWHGLRWDANGRHAQGEYTA